MFWSLFPVAGLLVAQGAGAAGIAPPRFVVVATDPGRVSEVDETYAALVAAGARVIERQDRAGLDLSADGAPEANARVDDVRASLIEARARLRELEVDRAGVALNRARTLATNLEAPEAHRELLAEVLLERATLLLAREAPEAARRELRLLSALDPERSELHPGLYPPNLVSAFAEVKAAVPETALLTVVPRPAGARVFVDGRSIQPSVPLTVEAGPHWVTVRAPGRISITREVDLRAGAPQNLETLAPVAGAAAARARALEELRTGAPAAAALRELTGADVLLFLAADGIFVERAGRTERVTPVPGIPLAAAALAVLTPRPPPAPVDPPRTLEDSEVWWIVGGASAAAVVVSTVIGFGVWYLAKPAVDLNVPRPVVVTCCSL